MMSEKMMIINMENYKIQNLNIIQKKVDKIKSLQNQTIANINNNLHELAKIQLTEINKIEKELKDMGVELI